ncbi:MAG: WG repeat-containing protein [Phycisphaerales bacterium]|nr:WG repeat-containing protein [Phycisphaerales bacterium]
MLWCREVYDDPMSGHFVNSQGRVVNDTAVGDRSSIDFSIVDPGFNSADFAIVRTDPVTFSHMDREGRIGSEARVGRFGYGVRIGFLDGRYRIESADGVPLSAALYDDVVSSPPGTCVAVLENGKWGFVDRLARMLIQPQFDRVQLKYAGDGDVGGLFGWRVESGGQVGIMDREGTIVVPIHHEAVGAIGSGMIAVRDEGRWGVVAEGGAWVLAPAYDEVMLAGTNSVWVKQGKWGMRSVGGDELLPPAFDDVDRLHRFDEVGRAYWKTQKGRLYGIVSSQGSILVPADYRSVSYRGGGVAILELGSGDSFVDLSTGTVLVPVDSGRLRYWPELRRQSIVITRNSKDGLLDFKTGKYLLPAEHDSIGGWHGMVCVRKGEHLALFTVAGESVLGWDTFTTELPPDREPLVNGVGKVVCAGKAGLINEKGLIVLACLYQDVGSLSEGLVPAKQEGLWGYVSLADEWIIPPRYEQAEAFHGGYAAVRQDGKVGLINRSGRVKVPFQYADAGYVLNGRFPVAREQDGKLLWGIADIKSRVILPLEYDCVEWIDLAPDTTRYHGKPGWMEF